MTQRHVVLLRWSCAIVRNPKCLEVLNAQKIFTDVVRFQFRLLLDLAESHNAGVGTIGFKRFGKLFSQVPPLSKQGLNL